jgi:hypothetical protein
MLGRDEAAPDGPDTVWLPHPIVTTATAMATIPFLMSPFTSDTSRGLVLRDHAPRLELPGRVTDEVVNGCHWTHTHQIHPTRNLLLDPIAR